MTAPPLPAAARSRARWVFGGTIAVAAAATFVQAGWMERAKASLAAFHGASREPLPLRRLLPTVGGTVDLPAAIAAAVIVFVAAETLRLAWRRARDPAPGGFATLLPRGPVALGVLLLAARTRRFAFAPRKR